MSVFYSTQFTGMTGGSIATGWTATAGTRWVIATSSQHGSECFQCSGGTGAQSCYNATLNASSLSEDVDVIVQADRQSGGLYDFQVDFCLGASGSRAQGFTTRIRRASNALHAVEVTVDVLGGDAGTPTGSLDDPFAWTWRIRLTWAGADATITVYALQQDFTWSAVYTRSIAAASVTASAGYVGLHGVATTGRVFLNFLRVAIGTSAYAMMTRPFADGTPFPVDRDGSHKLRITGVCANGPTAIEGRFVPDAGGDPDWQTIDSSPGSTFSGTITSTTAGTGTVQIRPANNTNAVDSIAGCEIGILLIGAGQSNMSGRAASLGVFTPGGGQSNALIWPSNVSSSDPTGNQYWRTSDSGEDDFLWVTTSSTGSPWPEMASQLSAATGYKVCFISHAVGSTTLVSGTPSWGASGADWLKLAYNIARSGITGANAVLWWQGEGDANASVSEADYSAALEALRARMTTALGSDDYVLMPGTLGMINALTITTDALARAQLDPIRAAMVVLCNTYPNQYSRGATLLCYDLDDGVGADGLHFITAAAATYAATAWADAVREYLSRILLRPRSTGITFADGTHKIIWIDYDRLVVQGGSAASLDSVKVLVNGSEAAHTATISGRRVTVVLDSVPDPTHSIRVFLPTGNQGADGGTTEGSYVADATDTDYPAMLLIGSPSPPPLSFRARSRDRRGT